MEEGRSIEVGATLTRTWAAWSANLRTVTTMSLAFLAVDLAGIAVSALGAAGSAIQLGLSLAFAALFQGMIVVLVCRPAAEERSLAQLFEAVRPRFARLVWAYLLYWAAIVAGIVLLVLPGLLAMTVWAMVVPIVVLSDTRVPDAFGRSQRMVRGNGWTVFLVLLITGLLSALVLLALVSASATMVGLVVSVLVYSLVLKPLIAIAVAEIYAQLESAPSS